MLKKMYTNFQPSIFSIRTYSYIYFYPKELLISASGKKHTSSFECLKFTS